jgi:hypothetical protein
VEDGFKEGFKAGRRVPDFTVRFSSSAMKQNVGLGHFKPWPFQALAISSLGHVNAGAMALRSPRI